VTLCAPSWLKNFDFLINDLTICPVRFHPFCHTLQRLLQGHRIGIDHRAGNDRFLPFVLQIHLRHRYVELAVQTRNKRLDSSALFFERSASRQVQVDGEGCEQGYLGFGLILWNINPPNAKIVFDVQNDFNKSFGTLFSIGALFEAVNDSDRNYGKRVWRVFILNGLLQ